MASHAYEETKASFEFLFPLLSPGGVYLIEDWSWAPHPSYQSPGVFPSLDHIAHKMVTLFSQGVGASRSCLHLRTISLGKQLADPVDGND